MKLYEKYPTSISFKGVEYDLDLSFKAVLLVLDVFDDEILNYESKCKIALDILIKNEHPDDMELLERILRLIMSDESGNGEKIIDFEIDFALIVSAFRQAYGIDIINDNLHYLEFISLLNGMPDNTKLMDVLRIRHTPIPSMNEYNKEQVNELIRLKNHYSLNKVKQEDFQDGLAKMWSIMKGV